jgi:beta-glucuronidase
VSRRYRQHDVRRVTNLNGIWDFEFIGDENPDKMEVTALTFPDRMAVPACYDATPAYVGHRGLAAYRTRILLLDHTPHRLVFESIHHWCQVFIEGELKKEHSGGFTRFYVDLVDLDPGEVEIIVLVDNRFDPDRSPLHYEYFDWYHYGGITRGVALHRLGELWIDSIRVITESIAPPEISIEMKYDSAAGHNEICFSVAFDNDILLLESLVLPPGPGTLNRSVKLAGASLWHPDTPNLHTLYVRLAEDDYRERIGLRKVSVQGQHITINDQPFRLLGFNRHEAHPQFGHSVPEVIQVSDVQQLQDMGCNFVRGSHYPQDPHFLDLCDEAGLCVWSEAIGWQHTAVHITDPHFLQAQINHINEMVAATTNHPSVILWGILNESDSNDEACRPGYETLLNHIRQQDTSRPVTYATHRPYNDVCLDLVDVISINCYPGWYGSEISSIPEDIDSIIGHIDSCGYSTKPIIISEIGAGAIPGWRDWNGARWSEQYQAQLVEKVIRYLFIERKRVCGLSLWQFCDCRISEAVKKILGRPRGFNNKGVVDEYRRPKLAYEVVKKEFNALRK